MGTADGRTKCPPQLPHREDGAVDHIRMGDLRQGYLGSCKALPTGVGNGDSYGLKLVRGINMRHFCAAGEER